MNSTLIFEAISSAACSDVGSPRMRTRVKNAAGETLFLEVHGLKKFADNGQIKKNLPGKMHKQPYQVVGEIKLAKIIGGERDGTLLTDSDDMIYFDYTQRGILAFLNHFLGTHFTTLEVDAFIHVHDTQACLC